MAFDLSTISDILKIDYQGPIREQLNSATILLSKLRRNDREYQGKQAYLPLHKGRNVGVGARAESGTLPSAGNQQYDKAVFTTKYNYGRIRLTGPAIEASRNNVGSFVRAIQSEIQGLMRDLKVDLNRQLFHDGTSCLTQTISNSGTTIEVESTRFLQTGMQIVFANGADGTDKSGAGTTTVSSITDSNTFVASTAPGSALDTNDIIIRGDSADPANASRDYTSSTTWRTPLEMWGLEAVLNDMNPGRNRTDTEATAVGARGFDQDLSSGRFGEINRVGDTFWDVNMLSPTAPGAAAGADRDLTLDLMQQAFDEAEIEGDADPGLILTNHAIKRRYAALLQADKRYPAGGEITLDGGYRALEFNGVPLVADKDASLTATPQFLKRLYFITMSSMEMLVLSDWKWMERDGAVLCRVANKDEYEATLYAYMQLACDRPNANSVLDGINES